MSLPLPLAGPAGLPRSLRPWIALPAGELLAEKFPLLTKNPLTRTEMTAPARPPVLDLLEQIDLLEIRFLPEPAWLPPQKPKIFHWNYGLIEREFASLFRKLSRNIDDYPLFSADLGPAAVLRQGILPLSASLSPQKLEEGIGRSTDLIRKYFKGRIALENYNYYPTGLYEHICEPQFIGRILEKFGLFLVLDLAHAQVSAHNLNLDFKKYLLEMPLDRTAEIHLSRAYIPKDRRSLAADRHLKPGTRELGLLDWLLDRLPQPDPVLAIECYQSLGQVTAAYEDLYRLLDARAARPPAEAVFRAQGELTLS
ncbi:MAG: DUF692 family protein [Deltaproteobacteria bacterium]|jgi:hypothetical protein|nr:DUF692 family protein [Deltaproteobacteria bacterium]